MLTRPFFNVRYVIIVAFFLISVIDTCELYGQVYSQKYSPSTSSLMEDPIIPQTITLGKNCTFDPPSTNNIDTCAEFVSMSFQDYLKVVVASEVSAEWGHYSLSGTQEDEGMNVLLAQSVAARSFAVNYSLNNSDTVCDNPEKCQNYEQSIANNIGNAVYKPSRDAVDSTKNYVLVDGRVAYGGIAPAFYAASTNNFTFSGTPSLPDGSALCSNGNGLSGEPGWSDVTYLAPNGYPCFADDVLNVDGSSKNISPNKGYPRFGHGAGMSQTGALRWAVGKHWNPNNTNYRNIDTSIDTTHEADRNDMGEDIDSLSSYLKDWRQILMHYYVYPFVAHKSNPGLIARTYQLSIADIANQTNNTVFINAEEWKGTEVTILDDVKAQIGTDSTEVLSLLTDESGRPSYLICKDGSELTIKAKIELDGEGVELTCNSSSSSSIATARIEGSISIAANNACLQAGENGDITIASDIIATFKDGGFISNQDGIFTLEDNAQISIESTAGETDIQEGASFVLGQNATISLNRNAEFVGTTSNPISISGGKLDVLSDTSSFWNTTFTTDAFVVHNGSVANVYSDSDISLGPGFHAQAGSSFKATTTNIPPAPAMLDRGGSFTIPSTTDTRPPDTKDTDKTQNHPAQNADDGFDLAVTSYPNPFNPTTTIAYELVEDAAVSIKVYNMLGQEVKTLVNDYQQSGLWETSWDGTNNAGEEVSSGTYLFTVIASDRKFTGKIVYLK